ncbi:LuxR C-terminal-related transcriptional regulator [Nocardia nova]|uniref:LuxR C-terminal-related transcriptional regulator n=1 Tax=Nocardia nova TaxID=37330 RepID=UPI0033ED7CB7
MFQLSRPGALPATSSEFVGRQAQRERIASLIGRGARLITLVGPGGIGKTRLAIESLRRDVDLPTRWLALADLDAAAVVTELRSRAALPGFAPHVLVLDTCDRVLTTVAAELSNLLTADPGLTVVATSRAPIGWIDEHLVPLPPLSPADALRLLRIRIELGGRRIEPGIDEADVLARICRHLAHNPFGLRLAAARLQHRPPAAVLQEVSGDAYDRRLHWSDAARVGVEARHRNIGASIGWSVMSCNGAEQMLLQRLSVFPSESDVDGGVDRDAIVAVCADRELAPESIDEILDRLVERSLVMVRFTSASAQWCLTECVRIYARAELHRRDSHEANRLAGRYRSLRHQQGHRGDAPVTQQRPCRIVTPPVRTGSSVHPAPRPESDRWQSLSRAEREVAVLAAAGWPNSAIAERRHSSVRTVDAQVATVRQKLGITSRTEIARHLPAEAAERMRGEAARRERPEAAGS